MLPERLAKPLMIWSVVAGLAPFLFVFSDPYTRQWEAAVPWLGTTLLYALFFTLAQVPLVAALDVICAVWGCLARPKGYNRSWLLWGVGAVAACLSGVVLMWIIVQIEFHSFPPPLD
ncbi:MAG: hypothetical protein HQL39_20315 [Alphaproteobacteria bacterium]|nr:hypothetical protein [Alphaproteobacteria bacterium]